MTDNKKAYILIISAVLCWSTVATAFKIALEHLSVPELLCIAANTACIFLTIAMVVLKKIPVLKRFTIKDIAVCCALGLLNPTIYYLILFNAYDHLPASIAQPLNFIWPLLFLLLNSILNKTKINGRQFFFMLISFAGIFILTSEQGNSEPLSTFGIVCAMGSALLWALYWILNLKKKTDGIAGLFISFLTAAIVMDISAFLYFNSELTTKALSAGIYVGVFEMGLPFVLWLYGLKLANNPSTISQFSFLSPVISLLFISLILRETLTANCLVGIALIIGGIYLNQRASSRT